MKARVVLASSVAAALVVVASTALADGGGGKPDSGKGQMLAAQAQGVNFISVCRFSHRKTDDPIVYPGKPGLSHDHSFVGNTSTNAFSTLATLRAAHTTCQRPGDTAAYWVPTLLEGGNPVEPLGATIYYRRRTVDEVHAFPAGLKMIGGDSKATSPQSLRVTFWNCGPVAGVPPSSTVPTCPSGLGSSLRLHVNFPNCWDGKHLDSADHRSHMAYSDHGRCPATHPVSVPAISLIYRYPIAGGPIVNLSSGGQYSGHGDFFQAWNQAALMGLVDGCLNALRHCGRGI